YHCNLCTDLWHPVPDQPGKDGNDRAGPCTGLEQETELQHDAGLGPVVRRLRTGLVYFLFTDRDGLCRYVGGKSLGGVFFDDLYFRGAGAYRLVSDLRETGTKRAGRTPS